MPMDFPTDRLARTAQVWKFREQEVNESESDYRKALHEHVKPQDRIESFEILFGVGWDKWTREQQAQSIGL